MDSSHDFQTAVQTFTLGDLPANTSSDARFFLVTGPEGWKRGLPELEFRRDGNTRVLRRAYPLGTLLAFNVLVFNVLMDSCVEGDAWGQRRPDRFHPVQEATSHTLHVLSWQDHENTPRPSTLTGTTETLSVFSPELDDTFTVTVWTPPQHTQTGARFPVLYLHDGGNMFDRASAFAGVEWECNEAAQTLAQKGLPCLMVAVTVRGAHRENDYVPFDMAGNDAPSSADACQTFLAGTLKPLIDLRFRTLPDARHTAQASSSSGRLASLYGGLSHPHIWGTIGAFSPFLEVHDKAIFTWSAEHPAPRSRLYLDMGTLEGDSLQETAWLVFLTRRYAAQMCVTVDEVQMAIGEDHRHDEAAWAARFPGFLRWWLEGLER